MSVTLQKNTQKNNPNTNLQNQQEAQRILALDPTQSVWVSASAGSGKTTLLTQRVLRLLLQNRIESRKKLPNILCLTYTKAAAAEMQNRIHAQLSNWAIMHEAELQHTLEATFEIKTNTDILKKARRLFAEVLERPDAIRIMTMHAFCQMILNRFPHEAGLAPHFTLLEGEAEKLFQQQVLAEFYAHIKKQPVLTQAFNMLGYTQATSRSADMLQQIFKNAGKWANYFAANADGDAYKRNLRTKLALQFTGSEDELMQQQIVPEQELQQAAGFLQVGSEADKNRGHAITRWVNDKENRAANFDEYVSIYLTNEDTIRKSLFTKAVATAHPSIADIMQKEAGRVSSVLQTRNNLRFYHQQCAFHTLALHLWQLTREMKARHAQLTYDDLILTTRDVLNIPAIAPWILYKLDGGIDHILIDEAQDTSPEQWDIVFALLEEILSGTGARADANRTLFVVGDEKQSIYSFQGANHAHYLAVKERLFEQFAHLSKPMIDLERVQSFRSTSAVLSFVDTVFDADEVRSGVSNTPMRHFANRGARGYVECWSPIKTEKKEFPDAWEAPMLRDDTKHAYLQLAARIADTIHTWLTQNWHIKTRTQNGEQSRAVKPDDIIILLQYRSHLLSPIIRALKERNIPVAGIDRMVLHEQASVQDILSLCRFLLLPQDDLTLAEVLRGPLIRISDEALFEIAHGREGSLWNALQSHVQMKNVCDYLKRLLNMADNVSCFALLSHIYTSPCPAHSSGKTALIQRLGIDALDPLEQLLSAARNFDAQHPLSLQLFVREIAQDESELKREQSDASGEVRIMTTHGAKGLEAPIVFMPDLMRDPHIQGRTAPVFWDDDGFAFAATPAAKKVALFQNAKSVQEEARAQEHRRLLYVALTRAADVLILCSAIKNKEPGTSPWLTHTIGAMQRLDAEMAGEGDNATWRYGDKETLSKPTQPAKTAAQHQQSLPSWLSTPVETPQAAQIYNPSTLTTHNERQLEPGVGSSSSFARGRLLHRLLQLLPTLPDDQCEDAAMRFLTRNAGQDEKTNKADAHEVMAVLRNPVFADVFSPRARAEMPIVGSINGKRFSGQIDRLLVTDDAVLVVDFKTNRPPPKRIEDVDADYLAQMACYHTLLAQIYPGKAIRAALLWTHSLTLMPVNDAALQRGMQILVGLGNP